MSIRELKQLPVEKIAKENSACFLWVTDSHIKEGIKVLESWGFEYKTVAFNWIKYYNTGNLCINVAPWTLKSWELCLLGTKGKMSKYKTSDKIRGLIEATRTKHSKKPNEVRKRINDLFANKNKIELFAREKTEGWDVWGNEIN